MSGDGSGVACLLAGGAPWLLLFAAFAMATRASWQATALRRDLGHDRKMFDMGLWFKRPGAFGEANEPRRRAAVRGMAMSMGLLALVAGALYLRQSVCPVAA
ncbi:hypothetical protein [Ancylobacter terrae]|uniref:hypothetical protein n=1 Tax=Ancylobacter sp. sgz301288 TaxID=3342077 RepID=UPI00385C2148